VDEKSQNQKLDQQKFQVEKEILMVQKQMVSLKVI
jgi:hypothetical protein